MQKKSYQLLFAVLLGVSLVGNPLLVAQSGFQKESDYFKKQQKNFEAWLDSTQLSAHIQVTRLKIKPNRLILDMQIQNKDIWFDLKETFKEKYHASFGKKLMAKFLFQMSVGKDSLEINIHTLSGDYPIGIYYNENKLVINEELPLVTTKGIFQLDISDIPSSKPQMTKGNLEEIKKRLKLYLRDHYIAKSSFWHKVHFSVIDNDNEVSFEISNIKKEVLDDFIMGYFEFITIDMYFVQKGTTVEVSYELQAKYGSGIFIAPRRSGYKDMEPKYQDYVEQYRKKFRSLVKDVINAKKLKG